MARFLEMVERIFKKREQNREALRKDPDYSSLEEMANDLFEVVDEITGLLHGCGVGASTRIRLERMRYKLATYLEPICCVCDESPARWTNDAYYCDKCVEVEK